MSQNARERLADLCQHMIDALEIPAEQDEWPAIRNRANEAEGIAKQLGYEHGPIEYDEVDAVEVSTNGRELMPGVRLVVFVRLFDPVLGQVGRDEPVTVGRDGQRWQAGRSGIDRTVLRKKAAAILRRWRNHAGADNHTKSKKTRNRVSPILRPLTQRQTEAVNCWARHAGSTTKAAKDMGVTRAAFMDFMKAAKRKLPTDAVPDFAAPVQGGKKRRGRRGSTM